MVISDSKTIEQIQDEFHQLFPGLKIQFYKKGHDKYMGSSNDDMISSESLIGDIRNVHVTKEFKISSENTVAHLESTMKEVFGLNVQIFRRSKELWLQTSTTDDWTLEKQNTKGLHSVEANLSIYDNPNIQEN